MQEPNVSDKKLLDLLTELADVEAQNAMLSAEIFIREGQIQVGNAVEGLKGKIRSGAQKYGRKAQGLANDYVSSSEQKTGIIGQYKQALEEINGEYERQMMMIMKEQQDLQTREQETYGEEKRLKIERGEIKKSPEYLHHVQEEKKLKREIKEALARGDLDAVTEKTEELRGLTSKNPLAKKDAQIAEIQQKRAEIAGLLEDCKTAMKECAGSREQQIENITTDRDNKLARIPKQNIIQKILGNLFNKMNGVAKFNNNVIANITNEIRKIKTEYLPDIKKAIEEKSTLFLKTISDKKTQITQGIGSVKNKIQQTTKDTFTNIINSGKNAKNSIKGRIQRALIEARKRQEEKQLRLSGNGEKGENAQESGTERD